jgi:hypothetical protein
MLDGQNTAGRANQTKKDIGPFHGDMSPLPEGVSARSKAVSQTTPRIRYASAPASRRRPSRATLRRMVAR